MTWMVGPKTLKTHTVPRITEAAHNADREPPRIIVGLPVCVHDHPEEAQARAARNLRGYEQLPTYRRQLDMEGLDHAGEIAVVGDELHVADRLQGYVDAGATEIIASVFPAGDNAPASPQRTHELLETLAVLGDLP